MSHVPFSPCPRRLSVAALVLGLVLAGLTLVWAPSATPVARAATPVGKSACRRIDPNLVNGVCLRYPTRAGGAAYTWIGTYRAANGRVFFCIDYLYDSRLPRHAQRRPTTDLRNQLGRRIGEREVAALNYLISRWAGRGSTGSDARDAAIALIIREVMGDGIRPDGIVVHPRGLRVGRPVRPPRGGLGPAVMAPAQRMWRAASRYYGGYRVELKTRDRVLRLGRRRTYRLSVRSAAGRRVPGVRISFRCRGPVSCPEPVRSRARPVPVRITPRRPGRFRIQARATGPAADGVLYVVGSWHAHGGPRARDAGTQRGWIAQRSTARIAVSDRAVVAKARPTVTTVTSDAQVVPGTPIHDLVTVAGLPQGYAERAVARLYGPFAEPPGPGDCTPDRLVGEVSSEVDRVGVHRTPTVPVAEVGHYTWTQTLPGNERTLPVTTACGIAAETTRVEKLTPRVSTVASPQRARVGDRIHDTIEVAGIESQPVRIDWRLHGPVAPRGGDCADLWWSRAPVADRGSIRASGSGRYRTASTTVRTSGCYTYSEEIAETATTRPASTPPGVPAETVLVLSTPSMSTVASTQRAQTGDRVHDAVRVRGLSPLDSVWVQWRLHGPLAPGSRGCAGLAWSRAPIADRGVFAVGRNGDHRSGTTRISAPGCYTYSESMAATATTEASTSRPGQPLETFLATRPPLSRTPSVPSGPATDPTRGTASEDPRYLYRRYRAPAELVRRGRGSVLRIPSAQITAPVDRVGLDGTVMAIPNSPSRLGWLDRSAAPQDVVGSSVISGHVSDRRDRPGAFSRLSRVRVGDRIEWRVGGRSHRFRVAGRASYPRRGGVPAGVFATDGSRALRLITCVGRRRTPGGGFHYARNLVVTAVPVP